MIDFEKAFIRFDCVASLAVSLSHDVHWLSRVAERYPVPPLLRLELTGSAEVFTRVLVAAHSICCITCQTLRESLRSLADSLADTN